MHRSDWRPEYRRNVISSYMSSKIVPYVGGAVLYGGKLFLKRDGSETPYDIDQTIECDMDGTLTVDQTMGLHVSKLADINRSFGKSIGKATSLMKQMQNNLYPDAVMDEFKRLLKQCDFTEEQNRACEEYAIENATMRQGFKDLMTDLKKMSVKVKINSGSTFGIVNGLLGARLDGIMELDQGDIKASRMIFENGIFKDLDWNLGYKKSQRHVSGLNIALSDSRESDMAMMGYTLNLNPFILVEDRKPAKGDFIECFVPEAKEDLSLVADAIRRYAVGYLTTEILDEKSFSSLIRIGNELKELKTGTLHQGDLIKMKETILRKFHVYIERHEPLIDKRDSEILYHLNSMTGTRDPSYFANHFSELLSALEDRTLPINLAKDLVAD
jgi:hypothetical protein